MFVLFLLLRTPAAVLPPAERGRHHVRAGGLVPRHGQRRRHALDRPADVSNRTTSDRGGLTVVVEFSPRKKPAI